MRVLYVCADEGIPLDGSKGASVHLRQTVGTLCRAGVDVEVLAARPGAAGVLPCKVLAPATPAGRANGPIGRANVSPLSGGRLKPAGSSLAFEMEALSRNRDLVGAVDPGSSFDVVYERYSLWSLAGAVLAERFVAPLVIEVNAPLVEEQRRYRRCAAEGIASGVERAVLERAAIVLCVSEPLVERAIRLRGAPRGVVLFPNSVDTDLFHPADSGPGSGDSAPVTVIFAGSFKPWHGLEVLLEAFGLACRKGADLHLLLIGDGPGRERLEEIAEQLGIGSRVEFTGAVDHDRVSDLLRVAQIAVAPYPPLPDFYFSPLKVGEYLASGLPVVASSSANLGGLLRDGESALLVPPGDVAALARAIGLLAGSPELRSRLATEGRRVAVESLSLRAASRRLLGLLDEACASRPAAASRGTGR